MSRRTKIALAVAVLTALAAVTTVVARNKKKNAATEVRLEAVATRDLVAAVTASGKIEPETKVDVSADVTGRILRIAVHEGDIVRKGQFLVQIDPAQFEGAVKRSEALLSSSQASLLQAQANRDQTKRQLDRALELQRTTPTLVAPETVEQAQQAADVARAVYQTNVAQVEQARAALKEARDNLARTTLYAPISGRVTRLAVEEGEVAVPGTFSRETGLLLTVADMSTIIAKVQVDETDVVRLTQGDSVRVTIDAFPDTAFTGRVSRISNSAKLAAAQTGGTSDRAVDFDVEVVLDAPPADIRPDLSCTARIVTDTRARALSIPIIALTVREHEELPLENGAQALPASTAPAPAGDSASAKKKEREGVFVVRDGIATFRPVKVGIAGDEYFEVLDGVRDGETIVAGTYQAIRDLKDGAKVREAKPPKGDKASTAEKRT
ncbi:MAG: efflux RND transporter periplasmic adaptor subunit [Gemmatimonadales bacterium]|jgi:HlyD family secretion protein|nr:efflux RND transporter periplasmic adaptor subunit [Gemmatimonadales bacterium]